MGGVSELLSPANPTIIQEAPDTEERPDEEPEGGRYYGDGLGVAAFGEFSPEGRRDQEREGNEVSPRGFCEPTCTVDLPTSDGSGHVPFAESAKGRNRDRV